MIIRAATPRDAATIAEVFNTYVGKATMVLRERSANDYLSLIEADRTALLVATDETNAMRGFASVKPYSPRGGYALAGEVSIFLGADSTGQGTGSLLYAQLLPLATQLGYRHLTAKVWGSNAGSIRFHERHGFRMVGRQHGIGLVAGKRIDVVLLEWVI